MADDVTAQISALLHEAGETHHTVYRITDGTDDDWASFYSDWLIRLSELAELLRSPPARSELTWLLVQCDKDYAAESPNETWEDWYAARVVQHLGT